MAVISSSFGRFRYIDLRQRSPCGHPPRGEITGTRLIPAAEIPFRRATSPVPAYFTCGCRHRALVRWEIDSGSIEG